MVIHGWKESFYFQGHVITTVITHHVIFHGWCKPHKHNSGRAAATCFVRAVPASGNALGGYGWAMLLKHRLFGFPSVGTVQKIPVRQISLTLNGSRFAFHVAWGTSFWAPRHGRHFITAWKNFNLSSGKEGFNPWKSWSIRGVWTHTVGGVICIYMYMYITNHLVTNLVLGSRSVGFTSATFFSQSKMSQSSLNWDILNTVQGRQCHIVFETWPKLARQKCSKLLEMTQAGPKKLLKIAQSCWKLLNIAQNCSKLFKMTQNFSNFLKMAQQVSKGVMCLHMQVRKLSLLGIAAAGVYCCMGLRSVSIAPRSSLLLRSEPSIVNFNWQGSLVIRLAAIVSSNGLSRKIIIALIGKNCSCPQFLLFHYCLLVIPHELLFFFRFCFWNLKGIGSKPDGSTPQIANSEYKYMYIPVYI